MQAKSIKEVLIAAKWILQHNSWCRVVWSKGPADTLGSYLHFESSKNEGVLALKPNCFCISGAVRAVKGPAQIKRDAESLLNNLCWPFYQNVMHWNDAAGRTKRQVVRLLDRAIKKAE